MKVPRVPCGAVVSLVLAMGSVSVVTGQEGVVSAPPPAPLRLGSDTLRHPREVKCLTFSPDGRLLASACSARIRLWDTTSGELVRELPIGAAALAFTPDRRRLVSARPRIQFSTQGLQIWDVETGAEITPHTGEVNELLQAVDVTSLTLSPDAAVCLTASATGKIELWDLATGRLRREFPAPSRRESDRTVAFAPDGDHFAFALGKLIQVFDAHSDGPPVQIERPDGLSSMALLFSADGKATISIGLKAAQQTGNDPQTFRPISIWNSDSGEITRELTTPEAQGPFCSGVALSADGTTLVSGHIDCVCAWDAQNATLRKRLPARLRPGQYGAQHVAVSRDGRLAAAVLGDSGIQLWDLERGECPFSQSEGHTNIVRALAWGRDGDLVATGGYDGFVKVWDSKQGRPVRTLEFAHRCLNLLSLSISRDGQVLSAGGDGADDWRHPTEGIVKLWDFSSERVLGDLRFPQRPWRIAVSPDARLVAMARSDEQARNFAIDVVDSAGGKEVYTLQDHAREVAALDFSTDGAVLWSASADGTIRSWDIQTGEERQRFTSPTPFQAATFLLDRPLAVTEDFRKTSTLSIWDLTSGQPIQTLPATRGGLGSNALALSPDGRLLVGARAREDLHVIETASGHTTLVLPSEGREVHSVAFAPDGMRLLAGYRDGTALIWDVSSAYEPPGK